jgi:D-galactarolactone cycloisomerase
LPHAGFKAVKLKVGFGLDADERNVASLRQALGAEVSITLDANQAWSLPEAQQACRRFEPYRPTWMEEPLAADAPASEWRELASSTAADVGG